MRSTLPHPLLSELSEFLAARTGLYFPQERWGDLERGIAAAARDFELADAESCAHRILSTPTTRNAIEILARHLTVGETYFFREKKSFEALEEHILPELLRARGGAERRLRIWSAGCCTGEEPYSIAMLIDRFIPNHREWNITILASDINPGSLRKAARGVYGEWSFRDTPDWIRERYFKKMQDGRFEIHPHIRKMVTFSYLNLADDVYPALSSNTNAMDIIFCRNVLMYFNAERVRDVARNLYRSLIDGGWLIVSPAETSSSLFPQFKAITFPGAILYRKAEGAASLAGVPGYPASMPGPLPGAMRMPEAALPPKDAQPAPPAAAANAPVQPVAESAVARPPIHDEPDALRRMARSQANQGKLTEAIAWCEKAIAAGKLNPATHYLLGIILQEQGKSENAVQSLMRAIYLDQDFVLAHFALGNLRLAQGRQREAERHFGNALALLRMHPQDEMLPESEGLTAGRLTEIITSVQASLPARPSGHKEKAA